VDVRAEISYPTGSPEEVFALVVDEDFRIAVCEATAAIDHRVDVAHGADGTAQVRVERTVPADVPDFVRSFVGKTLTIVQTELWGPADAQGLRVADLQIRIKGQPASMTGSQTLERDGAGTRQSIRGELKVSVPFLGKRIEPEVAKAILAAAAKQQQTGRAWLSRSR
jgi:Protein of unknown function (DUF2505)